MRAAPAHLRGQHDTPTRVYAEPASRFVGGFIGNPPMNFLSARLGGNGRRLPASSG